MTLRDIQMTKFGKPIVASMAQRIRKMRQDTRGNTVIMFGFLLIPIVGFTGLAVDGGRVFMVKSQLSSAVDVTALAAARTFSDPNRDDHAREFFTANFTADLADTKLSAVKITPSNSGTSKIITVSASATVPTLFMRILGIKEVTVGAEAQAARGEAPIELVMALDNTGSMALDAGGVSRLTALKNAASTLINTIYGISNTSSKIHIGIIPYTSYVNVGRLPEITGEPGFVIAAPDFTDRPVTDALGWKGCVDADASNPNASSDLNNAAWNTAFDTLDRQPAVPVKASLFPSFQIKFESVEDVGDPCPKGHETEKTVTEYNPYIIGEKVCNEGICTQTKVPNPDPYITHIVEGCDVPTPTHYVAIDNDPWTVHPYKTNGHDITFGRANPYPAGLAVSWTTNYRYIPAKNTERPPLPYPSRSTNRASTNIPPLLVYNTATPTSDNFTNASVNKIEENPSSDPYTAASPNTYCPQQALPLNVHTKTAVLGYINSELKAFFPAWGTMSNQGLVWSWRMLSPGLPLAGLPTSSGFAKIVILMTDGSLYHPGGMDAENGEDIGTLAAHDGIRTPYGFGSEKTLVNNANANSEDLVEALHNRLNKTCANMRKAGITIYTVTVDKSMSAADKDEYRKCATKPNMYFDAPDTVTLNKAFATIADNLSGVRLVK
jgi:Flp pilus assembly protein TadG